ncbi:RimK family alpha-L-glutamate ligase [Salipaludibacillus sp. LMS25]|jgi:[lysine-biosynthesis-protein LysW]--L-2-aminoadipate ligase|uniref:RimK family alpha-L-glutamate ligase n=1 Tax=Salipaludibacillus sp. LMS25 TaxID=2924031 RepID=UPI0020D0F90C|nr:RimK family alpha-L-glutamate ligase [Salipaludibacillus sp. LMS25]UTR16510.1 RimK family alpha-L-glutamate ligase [Salipaludibacillus sp. LMS25]
MKILMCVTKLRDEERMIISQLNQKNITVKVILDSMGLPLEDIFNGRFDLALIRCLSQTEGRKRAHILEMAGLKTINNSSAISVCTNKILQALLFQKNTIAQPNYMVAFTPADLMRSSLVLGTPFLIKPATSSWGRGISLIDNQKCLDAWLAARESLDVKNKEFPVLAQEFINKGNFDIRVVIIGTRPVVAFKRVSDDSWKTNTHLGASVIPLAIDSEIEEIVLQVVKAIGAGVYGLDLLYDLEKEEYIVCEINQNPEFAESSKEHKVDIPFLLAGYVEEVINQERKEKIYG